MTGTTRWTLNDGREAVVRPVIATDLEPLARFFERLPPETKQFLRVNSKNRSVLTGRVSQIDGECHWRHVAVVGGEIVGDATLDREPFGWTRHVGELRIVLEDEFEPLGLRGVMCEQMIEVARSNEIEKVQTEVLAERESFIRMLEHQGFRREVVRKNHARGMDGKLHDVVILASDVEEVWRQLEDHIQMLDQGMYRWSGNY